MDFGKKKLGRFYKARELADLLGVERVVIYGFARSGALPAYRIGPRRLRFRAADVDRFLAARRVQPGE